MPADYNEVLRDLDTRINTLTAELSTLKAARPTIERLRDLLNPAPAFALSKASRFADMGATEAIPELLRGVVLPPTTENVANQLLAGGIRSNAQNFVRTVSATLSQLRDRGIVEKVGDGWRLPLPSLSTSPILDDQWLRDASEFEPPSPQ